MALNEFRFLKKIKDGKGKASESKESLLDLLGKQITPKHDLGILSSYSRAVGKMGAILDAPVRESNKRFQKAGVSQMYNPNLGMYMNNMVEPDSPLSGEKGFPMPSTTLSAIAPLTGDLETGKYSNLDIAFGALEATGVAGIAGKKLKSILNKTPLTPPQIYKKKLKKVLEKGGVEKLKAARKWQEEWVTDPETFVRQEMGGVKKGSIINLPDSDFSTPNLSEKQINKFIKLARKPDMSRSKMKKEGFIDEYNAYLKYKDDTTKEFNRLVIQEDLPYDYEYGEFQRPLDKENTHYFTDESTNQKPDKANYGFTPVGEQENIAGRYSREFNVNSIESAFKNSQGKMGRFFDQVEISPTMTKNIESVAVHELQHYTTKGNKEIPHVVKKLINSLKKGDKKELIKIWKKENFYGQSDKGIVKALKATDKEIENAIDYFSSNTEIQARLQQIRFNLNVKPGESIKSLQGFKADANSNHWLNDRASKSALEDLKQVMSEENILKALNSLPAIVPLTAEEELFNEWNENLF
tara:strand:+ start:69 stop:1643 length:1575 start_codon:yes stop_codon:yes gene_type:complete